MQDGSSTREEESPERRHDQPFGQTRGQAIREDNDDVQILNVISQSAGTVVVEVSDHRF